MQISVTIIIIIIIWIKCNCFSALKITVFDTWMPLVFLDIGNPSEIPSSSHRVDLWMSSICVITLVSSKYWLTLIVDVHRATITIGTTFLDKLHIFDINSCILRKFEGILKFWPNSSNTICKFWYFSFLLLQRLLGLF